MPKVQIQHAQLDNPIFEFNFSRSDTVETLEKFIVDRLADSSIIESEGDITVLDESKDIMQKDLIILWNGKRINRRVPLNVLGEDAHVRFYFNVKKEPVDNKLIRDNTDAIDNDDTKPLDKPTDEIEMTSISQTKIQVKNLLTGEKISVEEDKLVKRGDTWYYIKKSEKVIKQTEREVLYNRRLDLMNILIQKLSTFRDNISYDLVIKASMILALLYTGNKSMAIVMFLVSLMCALANFKLEVGSNHMTNSKIQVAGKILYSFFASMFLIGYEA